MQSLLWSLQALEARVIGQLPIYQTEVQVEKGKLEGETEMIELIKEAVLMLLTA